MRKLTAEEIQKELDDIARWPTNAPFVFMKNLYDNRYGFIMYRPRGHGPIMLSPHGNDIAKKFPEKVRAESLRELIEAGWVVD